MSGVKRHTLDGGTMSVYSEYVLASDYDTLRTEAERLKGQVKMLVNQHMPLTDKDCPDGWSRVIEAIELAEERDTLRTANQQLSEALVKAEAMLSELDHIGEMTELGVQHLVEIRDALSTTANGEVAE